ncbi:DUF6049 family protein [Actinokineospora pegani]|uniref:DUF6049 family protein n=1 Tax=Actinokineospora pegani TaxID=2654637 RepID=UPI0012EAFB9E|nr:DUF6049 family protein [Actinokineospora pegani]
MSERLRRTGLAVLAAVLVVLVAPLPQAAAAQQEGRLRVDLDQLSPRVVDLAATSITVTGSITNTGDRRVSDIEARLQRGGPLEEENALRAAIDQPQQTDAINRPQVSSTFQSVAGALEPGASTPFSLTVALGPDRGALRLDKPGVYPVALNFNGVPEFGRTERVGALSTLLPVLADGAGGQVPPPAQPSRVTVLWPLVDDRPRQVQTPLDGGRPVFSDDGLSASLSGGRLFNLVDSVRKAATDNATVLRSLCFAIDPDLVATVRTMTEGYQVRTPDGRLVEGSGGPAAQFWLDRVAELVRGQCVVAMPHSDADLSALTRVGAISLMSDAVELGAGVQEVLDARPMPGVVWPVRGTLDDTTTGLLSTVRRTTVLAESGRLTGAQGQAPYRLSDNLDAVPYDQLIARSLSPVSSRDDAAVKTSSVQNGLATLVFRSVLRPTPDQALVVAPPRRWNAGSAELAAFLQTVQGLEEQQYVSALSLQSMVEGPTQGTATGLSYDVADAAAELPMAVTTRIAENDRLQRELANDVLFEDDTRLVEPSALVQPLREGLVRASSTAWRGTPDRAAAFATAVENQMAALLGRVTVVGPTIPVSLASSNSPIPIFISNDLPVAVQAKINLGGSPGLRPDETMLVRVPAKGGIQRYLDTEVTRSGKFSVDVWLTTEGGTRLSATSRVDLSSTSYGSITLAVTFTAAGVLVLLVGLRLFRRIRARQRAAAETASDL